MELINEGVTKPQELLDYLDRHFEYEENRSESEAIKEIRALLTEKNLDQLYDLVKKEDAPTSTHGLVAISNYKGNWRIGFEGVPGLHVVLCIFTYFETVQAWDGLEKVIFNHGKEDEVEFNNVAGCLGDRGFRIAEVINFVAANSERIYQDYMKGKS